MLRSILPFLACLTLAAGVLPSPKRKPVPSAKTHGLLIRQGVALHDQRDYDGAIAKYQEVLKENPDDVNALYELAFSYFAKKDYQACVDASMRGASYNSDLLSRFYANLASCLDDMGQPKKAIGVYREAIKRFPNDYLLHYNLGLTYLRQESPKEARKCLQKAIALNPNHASSHLRLGMLYAQEGYRLPALFALWRFLILEPSTPRSAAALQRVGALMDSFVKRSDPTHITITLAADAKKDEGDFMGMEMMLGIALASLELSEEAAKLKHMSELQRIADTLDKMLTMLAETEKGKKGSGFAYSHYVPYFVALKQQSHVEPFTYYMCQSRRMDGGAEWLHENHDKISAFLQWSGTYKWSAPK
jgi:tetratricopeptide (TPR) repeat protein